MEEKFRKMRNSGVQTSPEAPGETYSRESYAEYVTPNGKDGATLPSVVCKRELKERVMRVTERERALNICTGFWPGPSQSAVIRRALLLALPVMERRLDRIDAERAARIRKGFSRLDD